MKQKTLYFKVFDGSFSDSKVVKGTKTESGVYIINGSEITRKKLKHLVTSNVLARVSKKQLVKEYLETI